MVEFPPKITAEFDQLQAELNYYLDQAIIEYRANVAKGGVMAAHLVLANSIREHLIDKPGLITDLFIVAVGRLGSVPHA